MLGGKIYTNVVLNNVNDLTLGEVVWYVYSP